MLVSRHRGCDLNTTQIIGAVLLSLGGLTGAGTFAYGKWKNRKPSMAVPSSDAPAPVGIAAYMELVKEASPTATADTRWSYAAGGFTEAEILRFEVARLGGEKKT